MSNLNIDFFEINSQFIQRINERNFTSLINDFNISEEILEEIFDTLKLVFGENIPDLKIDKDQIDVFQYDNSIDYGFEARLLTGKGQETELVIHSRIKFNGKFEYLLINTP